MPPETPLHRNTRYTTGSPLDEFKPWDVCDPVIWQFEFAADRQNVIKNLPGPAPVPGSPGTGG